MASFLPEVLALSANDLKDAIFLFIFGIAVEECACLPLCQWLPDDVPLHLAVAPRMSQAPNFYPFA